jgi:hypothetical protein
MVSFLISQHEGYCSPPFGPLRWCRVSMYSLLRHRWEFCPLPRTISILIRSDAARKLVVNYPPRAGRKFSETKQDQ